MKGLHGSIPLAVLAATAHAQAQVIGGSGGSDIGNHASIPTENTASTSVTEDYTDNHSFELEHEVHVYPHDKDHHHHRRTAGESGPTVIGGADGIDVGNSADIPTLNSFVSKIDEHYKDDHSIDIDKTTIIEDAKDHHDHHKGKDHHKRGDDKFPEIPVSPTVIGGPAGVDIGNIADIPTFNEFSSTVSESYKDDHSVDVDKNTIIKGGKDRRGTPSVIEGPGGADVGSSTFIPTVNKFSAYFKGDYKDDHSVDIEKTTIIEKPDHGHGHHKGDHKGGKDRRSAPSVIGGPGGVDVGNDAFIPTVNEFASSFTGKYKDDHSVDIDKTTIIEKPHHDEHHNEHHDEHHDEHEEEHPARGFHHPMHEARGEEPTVIGGPGGVDIGNIADIPTWNSFFSSVDESYKDDHSVDVDKTTIVKPHKRAQRLGDDDDDDDDDTLIDGPDGIDIGNVYTAPTLNSIHTQTHENVNDDHSVKIKSHEVIKPGPPHYEGHGEQHDEHEDKPKEEHDDKPKEEQHSEQKPPQPAFHSNPQPPAPAPEEPEDCDCTNAHEVVRTVTSTRTAVAYQTETAAADPEDEKEEKEEKEEPEQESWHGAETPAGDDSKDEDETPKGSEQSNSEEDPQTPRGGDSESESPAEESSRNNDSDNDSPRGSAEEGTSQSPNTDSSGSNEDSPEPAPAAPANYYHGSQVAAPTSAAVPTATGVRHAPATSAAVKEQASTFAVIPVQVPSGTPRAHGSVVVAASTPVASSSARYLHMPTGASGEQNEKAEATPVAFHGGARALGASVAGAMSVLAGVFVLLGFAL